MEYRTVSTKLPSNELTLFRAHCEKKGVTPASLLRELVLKEIGITIPNQVAGRNKILYDKKIDTFIWSIILDDGKKIDVISNISPKFIEDLNETIKLGLMERSAFINKKTKDSVPVPSRIIQG